MKKNSERVRNAYKKSGLSYTGLAKLTGLKRNSIACWITGKRNPNDVVTDFIEEKVSAYLCGGGEYINKALRRREFSETINGILSDVPAEKQSEEIMNAYDRLPAVSIQTIIESVGKE